MGEYKSLSRGIGLTARKALHRSFSDFKNEKKAPKLPDPQTFQMRQAVEESTWNPSSAPKSRFLRGVEPNHLQQAIAQQQTLPNIWQPPLPTEQSPMRMPKQLRKRPQQNPLDLVTKIRVPLFTSVLGFAVFFGGFSAMRYLPPMQLTWEDIYLDAILLGLCFLSGFLSLMIIIFRGAPRFARWQLKSLFMALLVLSAVDFSKAQGAPNIFPTPRGLESTVSFWEGIFEKYSPDQCVFHDEWNLDVVYLIKTIPLNHKGRMSYYENAIAASLKKFAAGKAPANSFEKLIWSRIPSRLRHDGFFAQAQQQIRCQRGVDLSPSVRRSEGYLSHIKRVLRSKGLPDDLAYVPFLESGFHPKARSRKGAVGLWQFMPALGRERGLRITGWVDERRDPFRSTEAAAEHFAYLLREMGSWPLAITAYHYGHNGMSRAIEQYGPDYMAIRAEHQTKLFKFAARNYYPSFLAVKNVAERLRSQLSVNSTRQRKRGA